MTPYSCSEEFLRKRRLCQKLSGKLRTLVQPFSSRCPQQRVLIPLFLSPLPPSEVLGWCLFPWSLVPCPAGYLSCLPGLIFTKESRRQKLCLLARPLDSTVVQTVSQSGTAHWQAGGFFTFKNLPSLCESSSSTPESNPCFKKLRQKSCALQVQAWALDPISYANYS